MDDWSAPAPEPHEIIGPHLLLRSQAADPAAVEALAAILDGAGHPAIVAGAGADGYEGWTALIALAERLSCPVFQEPFGAQAGFPQDHPLFAGHLPSRRSRLREILAPHDAVLIVGTGAIRQYPYDPGPLVEPGTRLALITQDPEEAHRSPVELAVLGEPAAICAALAQAVEAREHRRHAVRASRPATAARTGRAAEGRRTSCRRSRSASRATRCCSRRPRAAARSCTRASPRPRRRASSARWGCSASRCPRRSACAWRALTARC